MFSASENTATKHMNNLLFCVTLLARVGSPLVDGSLLPSVFLFPWEYFCLKLTTHDTGITRQTGWRSPPTLEWTLSRESWEYGANIYSHPFRVSRDDLRNRELLLCCEDKYRLSLANNFFVTVCSSWSVLNCFEVFVVGKDLLCGWTALIQE